jgi:hypothetical protein
MKPGEKLGNCVCRKEGYVAIGVVCADSMDIGCGCDASETGREGSLIVLELRNGF